VNFEETVIHAKSLRGRELVAWEESIDGIERVETAAIPEKTCSQLLLSYVTGRQSC